MPVSSGRPIYNQNQVNDTYKPRKVSDNSEFSAHKERNSSDKKPTTQGKFQKESPAKIKLEKDYKKVDLLTLKKQVIEEIRSEMQLNKGVTNLPIDNTKMLEQK